MADSAYQAKYLSMARLLWDAANGVPEEICPSYSEHLHHTYVDGSVSLVPLLGKFDCAEGLEDFEVEEAIELLSKVNPDDWPHFEDIASISVPDLLEMYDDSEQSYDYVEDNLSTAERVEKTLKKVIGSVFGAEVESIRSEKGYYPNPKNNFLQEEDGTFAGTFKFDGRKFFFEVFPSEDGWTVTYRLHWKDIEELPPLHDEDKKDKNDYTRRVRNRGWK